MASNSGRKKTKAEVKEYKNAVKLSVTALESTIDTRNANLVGSDELSVPDFPDDTAKEARLPWRIRVKRFIKKHTFEKYDAFTVGEVFNMKGDELREFIGEDGHFSSIFDFSAACLSGGKHGWYEIK